jgi:hypothetical protein
MITGGCLCGAVRYRTAGAPLFAVLCHCRDCQRASGTGHVPVMGMPKSSFAVQGETKGYAVRGTSGLRSIRHFCPTCGSLLFGTSEVAPDAVSIYVGTLDDPSVFEPELVMFKRDRHDWDMSAKALPEFETMPFAATDRD